MFNIKILLNSNKVETIFEKYHFDIFLKNFFLYNVELRFNLKKSVNRKKKLTIQLLDNHDFLNFKNYGYNISKIN